MGSNDIKAGDLVYIARGQPCCNQGWDEVGKPFTVERIVNYGPTESRCKGCGRRETWDNYQLAQTGKFGYPVWALRRVNPPERGETDEAYKGIPSTLVKEKV